MGRADLILITGGLGPTSDDITREAVSESFGKKLIYHPEIMEEIAALFSRRGLVLTTCKKTRRWCRRAGSSCRTGSAPRRA